MDNKLRNTGNKDYKMYAVLILYLLGIFMGAIDTGIVSPARTIIQNSLGVNEKTGIWMITIYTLTYASVIPISGKLADKFGRKYIYLTSIFLFGFGSLICGLSSIFNSFPILLGGRVVQAIGGGGIMPIATAEFGTSFPENKRGLALGLVGATFGIANILGSTIGSAILDVFGTGNWHMLFYINLPISIIIILGGLFFIKNNKGEDTGKIDKLGTILLIVIIVSLLYGLMNIDFFDFNNSIKDVTVYPYLVCFVLLIPIFIFVEKKSQSPILNFEYFLNPRIFITLLLSLIVGIGMMGMVFVPQFAENSLMIKSGAGGYFVAILGIFAGASSAISGKLVDKYGPKKILLAGFTISMLGALYLFTIGVKVNSLFSVCFSLILMGLGMGITMGTPLNYMMLSNTDPKDSNSALATLSLVRSIGTSISPAIMIGFIAHAGLNVPDNIMNIIGNPPSPQITQVQELNTMVNKLNSDPDMAKQLENVTIPDLNNSSSNMDLTNGSLPDDLLNKLQTSDVTTVTDVIKLVAQTMYNKEIPPVIEKIETSVQSGIDGTKKGIDGIESGMTELKNGISGVQTGINNMEKALAGINKAISGIESGLNGLNQGITGMEQGITKQDKAIKELTETYNQLVNTGNNPSNNTTVKPSSDNQAPPMDLNVLKAQIDTLTKSRNQLKDKLNVSITQKKELNNKLQSLVVQKQSLKSQLNKALSQKEEMESALAKMNNQKQELVALYNKTEEVKNVVPQAFKDSNTEYINSIEDKRDTIEKSYQDTINVGFKQMYITTFCINLLAATVLFFYKESKNTN